VFVRGPDTLIRASIFLVADDCYVPEGDQSAAPVNLVLSLVRRSNRELARTTPSSSAYVDSRSRQLRSSLP
jgi:hypothetical protein